MIFELNPLKWGKKNTPASTVGQEKQMNILGKIVSALEWFGKEFAKGLTYAVKFAIPAEALVSAIFPGAAPAAAGTVSAINLIQNAVIAVEQKYAASGVQSGTGAQKLAEVLTLTEQAVTSLLQQSGISADTAYITKLVNAVVAILNVQSAPATGA